MVTEKIILDNVHFEHHAWTHELEFYIREMSMYEAFMVNTYQEFPKADIPGNVMDAWDQIKIHRKMATRLIKLIEQHETMMEEKVRMNGQPSSLTDSTHPQVRLRIAMLRKDYTAWKEKFHLILRTQD